MATWSGLASYTQAATDAGIRSVAAAVETMIGRAWTRASDTGQINTSTIVWGTGTATLGYSVWYLNDSEHATNPIYLKVTHRTVSSQIYYDLAIGSGTDGAGNLTTTYWSAGSLGFGNITGFGFPNNTAYASNGTGYAYFQMAGTNGGWVSGSQPFFLMVAREWNESTDAPETTGNFILCYPPVYNGATTNWAVVTRAPYSTTTTTNPASIPWGLATSAGPNSLDLHPVRGYFESGTVRTRSGAVCVVPSEAQYGVAFTGAVIPGFSHTWMALGSGFNGSNSLRHAVRWE